MPAGFLLPLALGLGALVGAARSYSNTRQNRTAQLEQERQQRVSRRPTTAQIQENIRQGRVPTTPSLREIAEARSAEYREQKPIIEEWNKERMSAARDYRKALEGLPSQIQKITQQFEEKTLKTGERLQEEIGVHTGKMRSDILSSFSGAVADVERASTEALGYVDKAQRMIDASLAQLPDLQAKVDKMAQEAMKSFKDRTADFLGQWVVGASEGLRQQKEQMAAQMRAAGYPPEQINAAMQRLDLEHAQQQAGQLMAFKTQEEAARRELQSYYDTMKQNTAVAIEQLRNSYASMTSGLSQAAANIETWKGATLAGLQTWKGQSLQATRALDAQAAATAVEWRHEAERVSASTGVSGEVLKAQGLGDVVNALNSAAPVFMNLSDIWSDMFAINLGLNQMYMNGLASLTAGVGAARGALGQAVSQFGQIFMTPADW